MPQQKGGARMTIDEIIDNFEFLDDWDDRYRYLIELGRTLAPLPDEAHNDANKVRGCASQVWLQTEILPGAEGEPVPLSISPHDSPFVAALLVFSVVGSGILSFAGLYLLNKFHESYIVPPPLPEGEGENNG